MDPDLNAAYALQTPEDNRRLYAEWAATYDSDFAARMAYRLPDLVAGAYAAAGGEGPVLDAGAGTGLLGLALAARGIGPVDGLDLSPEMLAAARAKGAYRHLAEADLTRALPVPVTPYAGVASSGTFTHGHVGPQAIGHLMAVMRPGGVFAASINAQVWKAAGFAAAIDGLTDRIADLRLTEELIYADAPDPAHRADTAMILTFRRR
ncbi:MAG: class I SAM-dependent methyltransferase [Paracoccaceae bacterium]|nr:MAG: class I SAM-dependent methyltransferase [Paracoccaceae bacterium]